MNCTTKIKQKRKRFNLLKSVRDLEECLDNLPEVGEVYKFVTDGGFSSISFIKFISARCHVKELHVSSFRIGKKELRTIHTLFTSGVIDSCFFAVGTLMANDSDAVKKYRYYENFKNTCEDNGWEYVVVNNHSKILLFNTDKGKFVIETSSNLNENPKIEQFSFEKDDKLYDFYVDVFNNWSNLD